MFVVGEWRVQHPETEFIWGTKWVWSSQAGEDGSTGQSRQSWGDLQSKYIYTSSTCAPKLGQIIAIEAI